ncbi:fasciclin-3-like isoform X1 [Uranotaenia lowii]|uniref:fasciclin-3-like isoform X1 n=1 Tax=Uranotaenia lowii TaxID=190385 RepID=UPI00247937FB|nr:fasciclin-3-like isoform X1 [Uranotaenia lowii]
MWSSTLSFVALMALMANTRALELLTEPKTAFVVENDNNVNLLCKTPGGQPIDFCVVSIPGVKAPFAASDRLPSPVDGITFFGDGWEKGSCGVTLATVKKENEGSFECSVSIKGELVKGKIDISFQPVPPEPPVIEVSSNVDDSNGEFDFGKPLTARCISRNGWPAAKLSWYLESSPITNEIGAPFYETANRRTTVQQFFRKPVTVEDNRKRLICRAEHVAYPGGYMETALPIKLRKNNNNVLSKSDDSKDSPIQPLNPQLLVSSDIKTQNGAFKVGSDMVVECVSEYGRPAASFLWFLDDTLIYEGLSAPFLTKIPPGAISVQQVLKRKVQASDNGKTLICKARHPTGTTETRMKISTF